MKWINKLNRGAILTGVIVVGIIVYLLVLAAGQRAQTPRIKSVVEGYVQAEMTWQMLPAAARSKTPSISAQALATYIQEQTAVIESYYIDNDAIVGPLVRRMASDLAAQAKGQNVLLDNEKTIARYEGFVFEQDRVTVRFLSRTVLETAGLQSGTVQETNDSVVLQKTGDQWKVVYATLNKPDSGQPGGIPVDKMPVAR
jgi:hypothetical protein